MAGKYLKFFPRPLLDDLVKNRWLPLVGAGFSRNASLPSAKKMPLWDDIGRALHQDLGNFDYTNALDVISTYCHEYTRVKLIERLHSILYADDAKPGPVHEAFCSLRFDVVCTTNLDFLLEAQYQANGQPFTPILSDSQLAINVSNSEQASGRTVLLKLHGDLNHPDDLVITEDDYDEFIEKRPVLATYVGSLLVSRTVVLVGYSLDDADLRQLWKIISSRLGRLRRPAYAITVGADSAMVARYARRGVTVINLPGAKTSYGNILAATFSELAEYWRANTLPNSAVLREGPLQELSMPVDSQSRMCFLGAPTFWIAYLQAELMPLIIDAGFVPVLAQDVITPGDNWQAKIEAILARSAIAIIARGSWATSYEIRAAAKVGAEKILVLDTLEGESYETDLTRSNNSKDRKGCVCRPIIFCWCGSRLAAGAL